METYSKIKSRSRSLVFCLFVLSNKDLEARCERRARWVTDSTTLVASRKLGLESLVGDKLNCASGERDALLGKLGGRRTQPH